MVFLPYKLVHLTKGKHVGLNSKNQSLSIGGIIWEYSVNATLLEILAFLPAPIPEQLRGLLFINKCLGLKLGLFPLAQNI